MIFVGSRLQTLLWLSISTLSRKAPLFYSEMRYGVLNFFDGLYKLIVTFLDLLVI